ncbi:ABC transporter permease [Saccharothrix sp. Mg75]|uniref:ABC transporter permease n=1 Tax=Saccharothrix sp. Mg75 TaxID=3445357 RepID=UPI003EE974BF
MQRPPGVTRQDRTAVLSAFPGAAGAPVRWTGARVHVQVAVLCGRTLRILVNDPQLVLFSLAQPLIMLTLFSQVFSSIANTASFPPGVSYVDYLMPAILVTTGIGSAMQSGVSLVSEMDNGLLKRLRAMPVAPRAVLVARSLADVIRTAVQLATLTVAATLLFGFRPSGGVLGTVASVVLTLYVSWALTWIFLALAAVLRSPDAMQMAGSLAMFPLMFASSAYVPIEALPDWLRAVAVVNPLTYAVNAARALTMNTPIGAELLAACLTSLVIAVVGMHVATRAFRRP